MVAKKKAKKAPKKKVAKKPARKTVKRAARRTVAKRKKPVAKKPVARAVKAPAAVRRPGKSRRDRISIVLKNLLLFGVLFILSIVIASVTSNETLEQLFYILAILTAFVAVAFLIILLVFVFMRQIKK